MEVELTATRACTLELVAQLRPEQWEVPQAPTLNPPLWELGHVAWFQEYWCDRYRSDKPLRGSILPNADLLFDSAKVAHESRWSLDLPDEQGIREYLADTLDMTLSRLRSASDDDEGLYFFRLALFHEKMHTEALLYTWNTLGYAPPPRYGYPKAFQLSADIALSGTGAWLGAPRDSGFVFDNEKWQHPVQLEPFEIATSPVLNAEYLSFVNDGGYLRSEFWDREYFKALKAAQRTLPANWSLDQGRVSERWFDRWIPIDVNRPVRHVSAYEAEAYCRWAKRRLPSEAEWQYAATQSKAFQWGDSVWEWTATVFEGFEEFSPDPYKEYSAPWFGTHRVVKGGSFATPSGMGDAIFRNFYTPDRADIFVGFRTCAL